jgi:uncharacterized membrane protein (DUF106 family)
MDQLLKLHMYKLATLGGGIVLTILGLLVAKAGMQDYLTEAFALESAQPSLGSFYFGLVVMVVGIVVTVVGASAIGHALADWERKGVAANA